MQGPRGGTRGTGRAHLNRHARCHVQLLPNRRCPLKRSGRRLHWRVGHGIAPLGDPEDGTERCRSLDGALGTGGLNERT